MYDLFKIEKLERKYFRSIYSCLNKRANHIVSQLNAINIIKDDWISIAFLKKTNIVDKSAERIIRQELLRGLNWNYLGIPISSDECFDLKNAVVHVDVKTQLGTERFDVANPNDINISKKFIFTNLIVSQNQTTLPRQKVKFRNKKIDWEPHLPTFYNFNGKKKPCLTYFVRLVYTLLCPKCSLIQDVGPTPQGEFKKIFKKSKIKANICVPFGKKEYSQKNSCKKEYDHPSYRLEEIVVYCVPNGELIKNYYKCNWFVVGMPYKSPIISNEKVVGISSARIILESFTKPTKVPTWWKRKWNRTYKVKIKPTIIIKGD